MALSHVDIPNIPGTTADDSIEKAINKVIDEINSIASQIKNITGTVSSEISKQLASIESRVQGLIDKGLANIKIPDLGDIKSQIEAIWKAIKDAGAWVGDQVDNAADKVKENIPFTKEWFRKKIEEWGGIATVLLYVGLLVGGLAFLFFFSKGKGAT